MLRIVAWIIPAVAIVVISVGVLVLAGVGGATGSSVDTIGGIIVGLLMLATPWVAPGTVVTIDAAARTVHVRKHYAYLRPRENELAFADIREIEIYRFRRKGPGFIEVLVNRH